MFTLFFLGMYNFEKLVVLLANERVFPFRKFQFLSGMQTYYS